MFIEQSQAFLSLFVCRGGRSLQIKRSAGRRDCLLCANNARCWIMRSLLCSPLLDVMAYIRGTEGISHAASPYHLPNISHKPTGLHVSAWHIAPHKAMPSLPRDNPTDFPGFTWCEVCGAYHPRQQLLSGGIDEPISSRTRARSRPTYLNSSQLTPQTTFTSSSVPVLKTSDVDDSEDSDYIETDSESDNSNTDSPNYEDEPIAPAEARILSFPLGTWERIDLEDHVPLDIIRARFPETRPRTYPTSSQDELVCVDCREPLHDDDWLDVTARDWEIKEESGDYCLTCLRLKHDFSLRAGFCVCRCWCQEIIQQASNLYNSDVEEVYVDLPTREPVPRGDLYAPSTLLDPGDDDSCSENPDFYPETTSPSRTLFPFDPRRAPANDSLFYHGRRYTLD
jgi:hypothetical protein